VHQPDGTVGASGSFNRRAFARPLAGQRRHSELRRIRQSLRLYQGPAHVSGEILSRLVEHSVQQRRIQHRYAIGSFCIFHRGPSVTFADPAASKPRQHRKSPPQASGERANGSHDVERLGKIPCFAQSYVETRHNRPLAFTMQQGPHPNPAMLWNTNLAAHA
jgi:hypothetical protein